jgi:NADPH-dependent ferric siderophore reductase
MARRPVPDEIFNGRLRDAFLLDLEVVAVDDQAPHVRAILTRSPDLVGFEHEPGQDVMFDFATEERLVRRRYTIRRCDPFAGTAEFQVEVHSGAGPATAWALQVEPGARIDAIGPRGKITLRSDASAHYFIADDSAMPAAFAMLEALPPQAPAAALLVTPRGAGSRPGPHSAAALTWLEEPALAEALDLPSGAAVYALGELGLVRRVKELLAQRSFPEGLLSAKAYWRRDQPNAEHGEP